MLNLNLTGYPDIVESAFVSSKVHPFLKYLATPLLLGPNGIIKNLGLPKFSDFEQCMFDNAVPVLAHDIKRGIILQITHTQHRASKVLIGIMLS